MHPSAHSHDKRNLQCNSEAITFDKQTLELFEYPGKKRSSRRTYNWWIEGLSEYWLNRIKNDNNKHLAYFYDELHIFKQKHENIKTRDNFEGETH